MSKINWEETWWLLTESARLAALDVIHFSIKPLQWCHERSKHCRWKLGVLQDISALEAERQIVAASEKFYGNEGARLCVRMGHEIARGDVNAAEVLNAQMQVCNARCRAETERLKQLNYEIEHRKHLLHRGGAVGVRQK